MQERRLCTGCNTSKPLNSVYFTKDKFDKSGFTYRCKYCRRKASYAWNKANPDKVKEANLKNRDKRKEFYSSPEGIECSRRAHLKRTYGITLEQYNEMLRLQEGRCAICRQLHSDQKGQILNVDHCHTSGVIRKLLCSNCNSGLGSFKDNKTLLLEAIKYLENYESNNTNGLL